MANISSDAVIDSIRLAEQGTPPDAPATGYVSLFAEAGGLYIEDSAAAISGPFIAPDINGYINIGGGEPALTTLHLHDAGGWPALSFSSGLLGTDWPDIAYIVFDGQTMDFTIGPADGAFRFMVNSGDQVFIIDSSGRIGIKDITTYAQFSIAQTDGSGGIPPLKLTQADTAAPMIDFAADTGTGLVIDMTTSEGTYAGRIRVKVGASTYYISVHNA